MTRVPKPSASGFTLIEVMIAIGIMTVGSLGILSMHHAVSGANRTANEMNTAISITERWVERIDRDSLAWSEEGLNTSSLNSTDYLKELAGSQASTGWFTPSPSDTSESFRFDYFGRDDPAGNATKYCVNLQMSWIRPGSSARVDIRTFWYREGFIPGGASHSKWVDGNAFRSADCAANSADTWDLGEAPNVNVVFASTVVRWLRREGT
jgi:prepilin-type N-terminal cleavage/methylation domain-containing protein